MLPITALSVLLCLSVTAVNSIACPNLKTAANYAVVAFSGVTNAGASVIKGNVSVYSNIIPTGFPPGNITGIRQLGTPAAHQAQLDEVSAYLSLKGLTPTSILTGTPLGGLTLGPGVYKFATTAGIAGGSTLTLSGKGIYVFQIGTSLITGVNAKIVVKNGATAGCIFWQVGSSVTHGGASTFLGTILAYASVTFVSGVTYQGSIYAQTGDVTLIVDTITPQPSCNAC
jgi:hypothetical protein